MTKIDPDVCWICQDPATTKEHRIKRSDLKAIFGKPSADRPLFLNGQNRKNYKVQGLNSDALKLASRICERCNSARTQPYDLAWERFSKFMRRHPSVRVGGAIRASSIFPNHTRCNMQAVQLYFTKLFGCIIAEGEIPIDLSSFSKAIVNNKSHPKVYLKFGRFAVDKVDPLVGTSHVVAVNDGKTNEIVAAGFFYELAGVGVLVSYANEPVWVATTNAYHPRTGAKRLVIADHSETL